MKTLSYIGAAATGCILCWHMSRPRSQPKPITWTCHCHRVQAHVQFRSDHIPSAECHCNDCIGFGNWTIEELKSPVNVLSNNGGPYMVQVFKDEFTFTKGAELIKRVKLTDKSFIQRMYTTCCHTSVGLVPTWQPYPMLVLYRENFQDIEFGTVWWRLYTERILSPELYERGEGRAIQSAQLAISFIAFTLVRVLYGCVSGRNKPDPLSQVPQDIEIIQVSSKDK